MKGGKNRKATLTAQHYRKSSTTDKPSWSCENRIAVLGTQEYCLLIYSLSSCKKEGADEPSNHLSPNVTVRKIELHLLYLPRYIRLKGFSSEQ